MAPPARCSVPLAVVAAAAVVVVVALLGGTNALVIKGSVDTKEDFVFLGRFCFDEYSSQALCSHPKDCGWLYVEMETPGKHANSSGLRLVMYSDFYEEKSNWNTVTGHHLSCSQKLSHAADQVVFQPNQTKVTYQVPFETTLRPHYFYFGLLRCEPGGVGGVDYYLELTNPYTSASNKNVRYQFSADDQGVLELYIFYFLWYLLLLGVQLASAAVVVRKRVFHPIVPAFTGLLLLAWASVMFGMIHWGSFSRNGVGSPGILALSELLDWFCTMMFLLLLFLAARGWGISSPMAPRLSRVESIVIGVQLFVLFVCYMGLYIWQQAGMSPSSVIYYYAGAAGIVYTVFRTLALLPLIYLCWRGFRDEPHYLKRLLFFPLALLGALWLWTLPVVVVISTIVEAWVRNITVTILYLTFQTIAYMAFMVLLWPAHILKVFFGGSRTTGADDYDAVGSSALSFGAGAAGSTGTGTAMSSGGGGGGGGGSSTGYDRL